MALPKKGLRNITVNNVKYAWKTKGGDFGIGLSIIPMKQQNRLIMASFGYHSTITSTWITPDGFKGQSLKQQIIITAYIVRQVILYAITMGWDPMGEVATLNLGLMDDKIDLRVKPQ